jgi:subtilisin family serine protease
MRILGGGKLMILQRSKRIISIILTVSMLIFYSHALVFSQSEGQKDTNLNSTVSSTVYNSDQNSIESVLNQVYKGVESDRFIIKYKKTDSEPKLNVEKKIKTKLKNKFKKIKSMKKKDYALVETNGAEKYSDVITDLGLNQQDSDIEYIQPDYKIASVYGDTYFDEQWGLKDNDLSSNPKTFGVNAVGAWNKSMGEGVTVAVIDTGIDINHEDLKDNIWTNKLEIPDNGIDDDNNGYVDDVNGWNFYDKANKVYNSDKSSNENHGTHIAGIIAAEKDDEKGIVGAAPKAKVMPLKVFSDGQAYTSDIIDAIEYAEQNGAKIVNCSWGTSQYNQALKDAISSSNMLFVCAAGNSGTNIDTNPIYPACYDCSNIISVGSINKNGNLSSFSNYGEKSVDVAAPGEDILSTLCGDKYGMMNGTSMAAGFVTAEAALMISKLGSASSEAVKQRLILCDKLSCLVGKISCGNKINCKNAITNLAINNNKLIEVSCNENIESARNSVYENVYNPSLISLQSITSYQYSSQIIGDTIPTEMETGKSYDVSVTVKNTGANTWTENEAYRLGAIDNEDPFAIPRQYLAAGESVEPGQTKIFTFKMTAPMTAGTYTTDWQMLREYITWFGDSISKSVVVKSQPLSSQIISNTIPTEMETGKSYDVSVTVKNTGAWSWTENEMDRLGGMNDQDPFAAARQFLAAGESIASGQTKTFTFKMTAPTTEGTYITDWQMVRDGVTWFGDSISKSVVVKLPPLASQIISNTIPTEMEAGKSYDVSVTVKNTGAWSWTENEMDRLGAMNDQDPFAATRQFLAAGESIALGQTKTFTFKMTAPMTAGTYITDWQMVRGGVTWFGDSISKSVVVKLPPYASQIISNTIPTEMEKGKSYDVSVTVKNTGANTWTENDMDRLGGMNDQDPFAATRQFLTAGESIASGQTKTFTFKMTAPMTTGTYITDWQMVRGGVTWFGDSISKSVVVKLPPYASQIISNTIPTEMEKGKSYDVSVTVKNTGANTWTENDMDRLGAIDNGGPFAIPRQYLAAGESVAPGQTKTFTFKMTAPSTAGTYTTDWQMVRDGVTWFGDALSKDIIVLDSKNSCNYIYDDLNRLKAIILPTGETINYIYDNNGNLKQKVKQ